MRPFAAIASPRSTLLTLLLFLTMTLAGVVALIVDAPQLGLSLHFFIDLSFVLLCLGVTAYLYRGWHRVQRELACVQHALAVRREERDAWRQQSRRLMEGLGEAIDGQLQRWNLTRVERQTAFLLLKGYRHKEIARLTERSDRTVRQHAVDIYRKSGLAGRAELSAFFLEDMLLPLADSRGDGPGGAVRTTGVADGGNGRGAAGVPRQ